MNLRKLAIAAALGTAFVAAHATVVTSTAGNTTTYTENFNGGTSFNHAWFNAPGTSDDYLWLSAASNTSSFSIDPGQLSTVTVSFWYSAFSSDAGKFSFEVANEALGGTGNVFQFALNNPGASNGGLGGSADQLASFTFNTVGASPYTFSFSTNGGLLDTLKVDDLTITTTVAAVPEPETYALMLAGLVAVGYMSRRRKG